MELTNMTAHAPANRSADSIAPDILMILFLIGLDVAARLLLHTWNVSPVAASALFAGLMLRRRWLALLVPLAALALSDAVIGFDDWRMASVVYAALALPAVAGILGRRYGASRVVVPAALACSLIFFAATNLAVWAFSGMYSLDMAGLIQCYTLALPFLKYTIAGDLFWCAALFGGAWLVQRLTARTNALTA
ncbi:MAG: hypothetical protein QOF05_725 [Sphingomonadales bacterium]|jgi:hypothetical protein|nr:hypothetical protein [Sphingomonadales bacterium]